MNLTETPDFVTWPETHYVFVEKTGSIPTIAPLTWQELHRYLPQLEVSVTGFLSLYKMNPQVYRAGAAVAAEPAHLPGGLRYERFPGGRYARFSLTGPHADLPRATRRVSEIVMEGKLKPTGGYHIERYVNYRNTPEDRPLTEILFPVV